MLEDNEIERLKFIIFNDKYITLGWLLVLPAAHGVIKDKTESYQDLTSIFERKKITQMNE